MTKEVRLLWVFLMVAAIIGSYGCTHKPAYSEINTNRSLGLDNKNSEAKAETPPASSEGEVPLAGAGQPASPPPASQKFNAPTFMDQGKGTVKDLPSYPHAIRTGIQMGPNQGVNMLALTFQTGDSMDQIVAFYQKAITDNQWTVVDKIIDSESSEWTLKKGEDNSARIQVKLDQATKKNFIAIVRGEKLVEPSK